MATIVPGRLQTAIDQTLTSATSPIVLYTVPAGNVLYLDYLFVYTYAFTPAGAATAYQIIVDQGTSGSASILRSYANLDKFAITFNKPEIVTTNLAMVALGGAGAGGSFSAFISIGGDVG